MAGGKRAPVVDDTVRLTVSPPEGKYPGGGEAYASKARRGGKDALKFLAIVVLYYWSNSFVIMTNKQLIGRMGFNFPIFLTSLHMATTVGFSYLMIDVLKVFQKQTVACARQRTNIRWLAIQFAVSLWCGNWSLEYIDVSYTVMVGATTPFFVCILGFVFFNTVYSRSVYASLVVIVGGALVTTYGKALGGKGFTLVGLFLTLSSTFFRGLKTVWQGYLLQGEQKMSSPNLLRYMATDAMIILFLLGVVMESGSLYAWLQSETGDADYGFWQFASLLVVNPITAYGANYTQFLLIQLSSALSFQVIGNSKGVLNVIAGVLIFGDRVTGLAAAGYMITLVGVACYVRAKSVKV
ncbi:sugar phosphate transporter [Chloropicon primus]|nr:sugar phosphate transporter [Chloropicon primus]